MNKTKTIIAIIVAVLIIGGVWMALKPSASTDTDVATSTVVTATSTTKSPVVPAAPATATSYTLAQVATHNTEANCWTAISGNVYNLTAWIAAHPGGAPAIIKLCGTDGTAFFTGKHGGQPQPEAMLATFKIGVLAQ